MMGRCAKCDAETLDAVLDSNGGLCDDCVLEDLDPEWLKEHYPYLFDDDDEDERND